MSLRIAVGQISSESNHFVSGLCELDFFRKTGYLVERQDVFTLAGKDNEIAGALARCTMKRSKPSVAIAVSNPALSPK